jgi:hypothetical protein
MVAEDLSKDILDTSECPWVQVQANLILHYFLCNKCTEIMKTMKSLTYMRKHTGTRPPYCPTWLTSDQIYDTYVNMVTYET